MRQDPDRLATLRRLLVLDSTRESRFDELTQRVADNLEVPIAIVNLLDAERDWFKACVGLPLAESPAATSFCEKFFETEADVIVAEDTRADPLFADHPLVAGPPFIRFYAGARLVVQGQTIGTLCAYDMKPRRVTVEQIDNLRVTAQAVIESLIERAQGQGF